MTEYILFLIIVGILIVALAVAGIIGIVKDFDDDNKVKKYIFLAGILFGMFLTLWVNVKIEKTMASVQDVLNGDVAWEYKIIDGEKVDSILIINHQNETQGNN